MRNERNHAGLFVIIGESFRSGGQGTRTRGEASSYDDQMRATKSQINALAFLESKFGVKIYVSLGTYHTQYTNELVSAFGDRIVGKPDIRHEDNAAGLDSFFQTALKKADGPEKTLDQIYDFVFFLPCRHILERGVSDGRGFELANCSISFYLLGAK